MADPGVLHALLGAASRLRASPKERKALIEAGLVESGIQNLPYGDRDSLGVLQERTSIYGRSHALSPVASAERFLRQARAANRPGLSAGALAQAVQRSAFPERYDQRSGQAEQILGSQGGRGGGGVGAGVQGSLTVSPGTAPGFDAGNGTSDPSVLAGLLQQPQAPPPLQVQAPNSALKYLAGSGNVPVAQAPAPRVDVGALAGLLQPSEGLPEAQGQAPRVNVHVSPTATASAAGSTRRTGVAQFEGAPVAAWIKPELEYARAHGWKGTVQSGVRSFAEQSRIYNSGTRPAAKPGTSNHEGTQFPRGAVDVTDAQTLARILRRKGSPLVWAGGKDPVHFSHPHGGSY